MSVELVPIHPGRPPWLLRDGVWIYLSARDTAYLTARSLWRARMKQLFRLKNYPAHLKAYKTWQERAYQEYAALGLAPPIALVSWVVTSTLPTKRWVSPPITDDVRATVRELQRSGESYHSIAAKMKISVASVYKIVRHDEHRLRKPPVDNVHSRHRARKKAGTARQYSKGRPACMRGHLWTPENSIVDKRGIRACRTCRAASASALARKFSAANVKGVRVRDLPPEEQERLVDQFIEWINREAPPCSVS